VKKRIAFFDFDGTITTRDTLLEIFKFYKGNFKFYLGFAINAPVILAWKAGIISNQAAKERMLQYFFGRLPVQTFQQQCDEFSKTVLPSLIRPKAMQEIEKHKAAGTEVVIVSASAENWIQQWCNLHNIQLIGTRLQVKNDLLTGKIENRNCHGEEKVSRINAIFELSQYNEIYCYGDSGGDKPMLRLATISFYKPFR